MTAPISCYDRSIWCCLCRFTCRKKDKVTKVATESLSSPPPSPNPTHNRTRTWKTSLDGKMRYEVSQTVVKVEVKV